MLLPAGHAQRTALTDRQDLDDLDDGPVCGAMHRTVRTPPAAWLPVWVAQSPLPLPFFVVDLQMCRSGHWYHKIGGDRANVLPHLCRRRNAPPPRRAKRSTRPWTEPPHSNSASRRSPAVPARLRPTASPSRSRWATGATGAPIRSSIRPRWHRAERRCSSSATSTSRWRAGCCRPWPRCSPHGSRSAARGRSACPWCFRRPCSPRFRRSRSPASWERSRLGGRCWPRAPSTRRRPPCSASPGSSSSRATG